MKKIIYLVPFIILVCILVPIKSSAIGVSPGISEIKDIHPDNSIKRQLHVSRAVPSQTDTLGVSVSGDGASFIRIPDKTLELPVGKQVAVLDFFIEPKGAADGEYEAKIILIPESKNGANSGVKMMVGVAARIKFNVTSRPIYSANIKNASLPTIKQGEDAYVEYYIINTGNQPWKTKKIVINLQDKYNENKESQIITIDELHIPVVQPKEKLTHNVSLGERVLPGIYTAHVAFYSQDGSILFEDNTNFTVSAKPSISKQKVLRLALLAGALIIIIILLIIIRLKTKQTAK